MASPYKGPKVRQPVLLKGNITGAILTSGGATIRRLLGSKLALATFGTGNCGDKSFATHRRRARRQSRSLSQRIPTGHKMANTDY